VLTGAGCLLPCADELRQLLLGPRCVDLGRVPCPSSTTAYLVAFNPLARPLHLLLDVSRHTELRGSKSISQVRTTAPVLQGANHILSLEAGLEGQPIINTGF
jgi:hypothetical protein